MTRAIPTTIEARRGLAIVIAMTAALVATAAIAGEPSASQRGRTLPETLEFDRHVASLLGRLGCNTGACHGSFQGRGGLNLSLFGHDPASDYRSLTREGFARRVNLLEPSASLLLLKPTGRVPHEGGQRFTADSWEYRVIHAWIAQGTRRDADRPAVAKVEVRPTELTLRGPGGAAELTVVAHFADGSDADVTSFCDLRVRDEAVVEVSREGAVLGLRPGDTAVVASYNGHLASARVAVPTGRTFRIPEQSDSCLVDREIDAKLRGLGVNPSPPASDAEFLRRVTLDLIGTLPSPAEVRAFLADPACDRRSRVIDALLAHPMHAALWATRFLDITGCDVDAMDGPEALRPARARAWHDWFRTRFAANVPFDQIARGVLCATSRGTEEAVAWVRGEADRMIAMKAGGETDYAARPALDLFWRRFAAGQYVGVEPMAERVAAAFLGVRIECAQCHKHPFDRWTQQDYRGFANLFADVQFGLSPESLAATARDLDERRREDPSGSLPPVPRVREVFISDSPSRRLVDPTTGRAVLPRALGGPRFPAQGDPRLPFADWLTSPGNPYFARSLVNRVWAAYFGEGLVEPVDGFSVANPPSHARLLDALADHFTASGFDLRDLERFILNSRAYQRSSRPADGSRDDPGTLARPRPRVLMAEVLVDALNAALGVSGEFGPDAPEGARAIEIATNRVRSPDLERVLRLFGRPPRTSTCDCERPREPAVPQTLFLMSDAALLEKVRSGRVSGLCASGACETEAVEELFLATLSRLPEADEFSAAVDHVLHQPDRAAALADVLWALINTREFVLNH